LRRAGQQWAVDLSLTDPWVNPVYGALVGLPPTAVYCGNLDLLSADVLRLQEQALTSAASQFAFVLRTTAQFMTGPWAVSSARQSQLPCGGTFTSSWASLHPPGEPRVDIPGRTRPEGTQAAAPPEDVEFRWGRRCRATSVRR
jgi:hypothetical protein